MLTPRLSRSQYLQFVGDNLLAELGHAPAFGIKSNPLGWLEDIASKWVGLHLTPLLSLSITQLFGCVSG